MPAGQKMIVLNQIQNLYCFVYRQKYMETTMQQRAKDNIYDQ